MIVDTASGRVQGVKLEGAWVFRGIPYAAPPVGKRRFKPPLPPEPWPGVRLCDTFGPVAHQRKDPMAFMPELPHSEDCLSLNVWTGGAPEDGKLRPVIVYIHGGGFTSGRGAECDGHRYASEDGIVYVSLNYRLGAMGFLYLGGLLGPEYEASGNNGMLDIVEALRWVKTNIAGFGGDPGRVTVMGNSAGGKCTGALYAMESASGLFHRAVAMSGATQAIRDRGTAQVTALRLLGALGLEPAEAHRLLELPAETLMEAQRKAGPDTPRSLHQFGPVADGMVIPEEPLAALRKRRDLPPLLTGSNEAEAEVAIRFDPAMANPNRTAVDRLFGRNADTVWEAYTGYEAGMPQRAAWNRALSEHLYTIGCLQLAEAVAEAGTPVWVYRLAYGGPAGAVHGYEGSLVGCVTEPGAGAEEACAAQAADGGTEPPGAPDQAADSATDNLWAVAPEGFPLARAMRSAWTAFVRTGDPNTARLPAWPCYGEEGAILLLDRESRVRRDLPRPLGAAVPHQVWRE